MICVRNFEYELKHNCNDQNYFTFKGIDCLSGITSCNHFICATKYFSNTDFHRLYFENEYCLIPKPHIKFGLFKKAQNYMICSENNNSVTEIIVIIQFCIDGVCRSNKKYLKNCNNKGCTKIENTLNIKMSKFISVPNLNVDYKIIPNRDILNISKKNWYQ
ncbi:hypothetical protein HZS_4105 [Henneguya salminicola]|nr:hypothetical protein HZS_4105 [Henneguya salminicola]